MSVAQENPDLSDNLAALQGESLKVIALCAAVIGYIWFYLDLWSIDVTGAIYSSAPISAWVGGGLLILSAIISYVLKGYRRPIATHLLVCGILGATACAVLTFPSPGVAYLFILPIIFASVLLSQPAFFLIATVASLLILTIGVKRTGMPLFSTDVALPVAIIMSVTTASWLSARNLHTALAWVWNGYECARRNERIARERQAELKRTLKALDAAYYILKRTNHMLAVARNQAEEARQLKQQFAQNISHELRTPLNLIIGFSETMANAPETYGDMAWPPSLRGDVEQIYRSSRHLSTMIDDILDLSALEVHRLGLTVEEVDISDVIQETASMMASLFRAKGLYLKVDLAPGLPRLRLDPIRIRQVLLNLLSNASRFTNKGGIIITARLVDQGVQVAVADTGVGIASHDVHKVFEEFSQVDGSTHRNHEGTGLGIPLSKRLIELHGGQMWLKSELGQGTTFYFRLPASLEAPPSSAQRSKEALAHPATSRPAYRKGLLVAEPDPLLLHTLRRHMDRYDVVEVPRQEDLPSLIDRHQPVALAVDSRGENVFTTLLAWSADVSPDLPVITFSMPGSLGNAQALGIHDYLIKPIVRQRLLEAIERLGKDVRSVLILDDDLQLVELLGRMLESAGRKYRPINAFGGEDVLTRMRRCRPDMVLLDLVMSDGLAVLEAMRADSFLADIPVIVISAPEYLEMRTAKGGQALGMIRREEFSAAELLNCLRSLLDALPLQVPPRPGSAPAYSVNPGG